MFAVPNPEITIQVDFDNILGVFQDLAIVEQLKQRWEEIKKLQAGSQTLTL